MKKTTTFFLVVGISAMIIGGIGSGIYFRRAEHSMIDTKKQTYQIKNKKNAKEIHLDLSGNTDFYISTEKSDKITMSSRNSKPVSLKSSFDVKEKNNRLTVSANGDKKRQLKSGFRLAVFDRDSSVGISVPESTERLIIDGKAGSRVSISGITTKDLSVSFSNADIYLTNIHTEKLAVETASGYLSGHTDIRADDATFKTTNGDIQVSDFSASNWSALSVSGDISLNSVNGLGKIDTVNGEIQATDLKGEAEVKSINGDFSLSGTKIPKKLSVETQQGNIDLLMEEILYDIKIKAKTTLGDRTIFGKERKTYTQGKEKKSFILQTNSGDISVQGPSDYDEDDND